MSEMISTCGLNCAACEAYLAYQGQDAEKLKEVAVKWSRNYDANLKPDDIKCDGCTSTGVLFRWCGECPIRACAVGKGHTTCATCDDFPCSTGAFLYNAAPDAKANIEKLRNS